MISPQKYSSRLQYCQSPKGASPLSGQTHPPVYTWSPLKKRRPEKIENSLLILADGWAVRADELQRMLCRKRMRHAQTVWHPLSFIGCTKTALLVCMQQRGVTPSMEAQAMLDAMPEKFRDWVKEFQIKSEDQN